MVVVFDLSARKHKPRLRKPLASTQTGLFQNHAIYVFFVLSHTKCSHTYIGFTGYKVKTGNSYTTGNGNNLTLYPSLTRGHIPAS